MTFYSTANICCTEFSVVTGRPYFLSLSLFLTHTQTMSNDHSIFYVCLSMISYTCRQRIFVIGCSLVCTVFRSSVLNLLQQFLSHPSFVDNLLVSYTLYCVFPPLLVDFFFSFVDFIQFLSLQMDYFSLRSSTNDNYAVSEHLSFVGPMRLTLVTAILCVEDLLFISIRLQFFVAVSQNGDGRPFPTGTNKKHATHEKTLQKL